jgi:hypothetical protein
MDIQYTVGVAQGVPVTFISVGPNNVDLVGAFLYLATYLLSMPQPPQVVTSSYGVDENTIDPGVASSLCNAYLQLGARGVSMVRQRFYMFGTKYKCCSSRSLHLVMGELAEVIPRLAVLLREYAKPALPSQF